MEYPKHQNFQGSQAHVRVCNVNLLSRKRVSVVLRGILKEFTLGHTMTARND